MVVTPKKKSHSTAERWSATRDSLALRPMNLLHGFATNCKKPGVLFMKFANALKSSLSVAALGSLALALTPAAANAATATTTFQVTANVQANCTIQAAPLAFGTYTGALKNQISNLTVQCTNTSPYDIGLDAGTASGATTSTRKMSGSGPAAGQSLSYAIFQDGGNSINWGNVVGTDTVKGTGDGSTQTVAVYGQIPAGQFVAPGAYADTITATVTY
jgi:spore coat protein U-like protein